MISKTEVFPIGQITKPHGVNGEMSFSFTSDIFDREEIPYFVFEIQGILVPFFLEEYRFKGSTTGLLKLEGVATEEQAREFYGLTIYLPKKFLEKVENTEIEFDYFAGFSLVDAEKGLLGVISEVDQTTENVLFVIQTEDDELLIPAGEEYIEKVDHDKKIIYVRLPEGLLDL
ncbi:MAG: ribosome maturation factor RimM [Bacteroidota bacterium]|nr:ribosome maturation factor RimM [Bacteroidota bacterium]